MVILLMAVVFILLVGINGYFIGGYSINGYY
jgi:hypothetical protein